MSTHINPEVISDSELISHPEVHSSTRSRIILLVGLLAVAAVSFSAGLLFNRHDSGGGRKVLYYHDPMHPAYKSDKPGVAPDCGMELEPVYSDGSNDDTPSSSTGVRVDPNAARALGIVSEEAKKSAVTHTVRTVGRVVPDETRIFRMVAGSEGWVRRIFPVATGTMVHAGDLLAVYYGRDYQAAQQSYLYALKNKEAQPAGAQSGSSTAGAQLQIDAALDNLLAMGVSDVQAKELAKTRETTRNIELRAPVTGFILLSNVYTGLRFERGAELLRLADLQHVWVTADLFGGEGVHVKPGTRVNVLIPNHSKVFLARISDSLPQFDPAARATRVRLEIDNPSYELRPSMFVDVEFPVSFPETIHVPVDAVVDSGLRKTLYVERTNGSFEPREVRTGWQSGDRVQIISGLSAGERVVRSGAFLLDSETRMKGPGDHTSGISVIDPVCGMTLSVDRPVDYGSTYNGDSFHFCSRRCKEKFESDKRRYASAARSL